MFRRDIETVCRDLELGFTADTLLPPSHRGRVTLGEFSAYFAQLPDTAVWPPGDTGTSDSSASSGDTGGEKPEQSPLITRWVILSRF